MSYRTYVLRFEVYTSPPATSNRTPLLTLFFHTRRMSPMRITHAVLTGPAGRRSPKPGLLSAVGQHVTFFTCSRSVRQYAGARILAVLPPSPGTSFCPRLGLFLLYGRPQLRTQPPVTPPFSPLLQTPSSWPPSSPATAPRARLSCSKTERSPHTSPPPCVYHSITAWFTKFVFHTPFVIHRRGLQYAASSKT